MARVLVVDDQPDVRALVRAWLTRGGHQTLEAASGPEALDLLDEREAPEVAVVDVAMPEMSGFTFVREMRERPHLEYCPVIFLSARVLPEDIREGEAMGARYLTKPFMGTVLLEAIEHACSNGVRQSRAASW